MWYHFVLLLPCYTCIFWFVTLLCRWKSSYRTQKILAVNAFVSSVVFFILADYFGGVTNYSLYRTFDIIDAYLTPSLFPIAYLYFRSLTDEHPFGWKDYLYFLPALFIGTSTLYLYMQMDSESAVSYIREVLQNGRNLPSEYLAPLYKLHYIISVQVYNFVFIVQGIGIGIYAIVSLLRYRRRLNEFYSNMEGKDMHINYAILFGFLASMIFSLGTGFMGRFFYSNYPLLVIPLLTGWAISYYFLYYQGSLLKYTAEGLAADLAEADREATEKGYIQNLYDEPHEDTAEEAHDTTVKIKIYPQLIERLNNLIDHDKIYLKNDLRLDDLARDMRTNRTYISRLINDEYNNTFSEFINKKRIEYAKSLASSDIKLTQEQIAERSGFLYPSTFSRTFKQQTGITFREWQKRNT